MIDNQHIGKGILAFLLAAILALFGFMAYWSSASARTGSSGLSMAYENTLFDTSSVIEVDIDISEDDWADLLENATAEEYYDCNVAVNGTTYEHVGLRAKGNTSLSMVASSDSDRYSFKIKFDEYVDGQNCDGLSKLVLNNNYSDATMMKEALCYDMFAFLGADASLYNYAKVSVNGEYWGVYLALEPVEESFAIRNYGADYGQLYKPDSMEMGGPGKMKDVDMSQIREELGFDTDTDSSDSSRSDDTRTPPSGFPGNPPSDDFAGQGNPPSGAPNSGTDDDTNSDTDKNTDAQSTQGGPGNGNPPGGGQGGGFGGDSAASLNYIDDELSSYETIWESSVFKSTDKDHRRVVSALKNICADDADAESLSESMDVDNVLRYMAVQTFVVNLDSLTGSMAHNYYLYEDDGQLNIIPWDYNLAFGGFQSGSASETINFPIDTPFSSGVDLEDRQFFMALLENETYLAQYHEYLSQLVEEYVNGGGFDSFYDRVTAQIDELVQEDPTSFYTYDEYTAAAAMLKETVKLRAASVQRQLDGSIPSTRDGQSADSSGLIDTSAIDLSVMGVMNGGGKGDPDDQNRPDGQGGPGGQGRPDSQGGRDGGQNSDTRGSQGDFPSVFPGAPPSNGPGTDSSNPDSGPGADSNNGQAAKQT